MSTTLHWKPHEPHPNTTAFSFFIKRLVQQTWGTPAVLSGAHIETLRHWMIFARLMAGTDWQGICDELEQIADLIATHGSIELYEY